MTDYRTFRNILGSSKQYEFDDTRLTITGYYTGDEAVIDFGQMDEDMFDELAVNDAGYEESMRILAGSKRYEFNDSELSVSDYRTGSEVVLDLGNMSEEMYNELACEEELDEDYEDDFENAVNSINSENGVTL